MLNIAKYHSFFSVSRQYIFVAHVQFLGVCIFFFNISNISNIFISKIYQIGCESIHHLSKKYE